MIIHSNQYSFRIVFFLPLMLEKLIHQSDSRKIKLYISRAVNKSLVGNSTYFIIEGGSYPTYILNHL